LVVAIGNRTANIANKFGENKQGAGKNKFHNF
jgi:hypothetical protein